MTATKPNLADRLAVCSWSLHAKDPADLIAQMSELGLRKTQLNLSAVHVHPQTWGQAGQQLKAAGVTIVSGMFGCHGEDYSTLEAIKRTGGVVPDATWDANWRDIQKVAPMARDMGLKLVSFHAGFLPDEPSDPAYAKLQDRIGRIAELFEKHGLSLIFETGQERAATLKAFLDRMNRKNIGVNFDPANMILYAKGDPVQSVRTLGAYVMQCHIKDAKHTEKPGTWGTEVAVGTGDVDWVGFFTALKEMKFAGPLVIEREAGDQRIPDIRQAVSFLTATMAKVG